ncbi:MAG: Stp1/IreP family PP2C-type Ser/Thr phosphatase [Chromatiales bacterium]
MLRPRTSKSFMVHNLEYSAATEVGLVRRNNQDSYYVSPELGLVIVADGMGGHRGGEIASAIAVRGIRENLLQKQWQNDSDEMQTLLNLGATVETANRLIREEAAFRPELTGMGTTLVAAQFRLGRIFFAHVGDSRLYRFRDGQLQQLTRDHSLVQELVDSGTFIDIHEAEAAGIGSNVLTRGLGIADQVEVDMSDEALQPDDLFLFCSDGLTNMLTDREVQRIINDYQSDLELATEKLVVSALSAGGLDNITVVLSKALLD